VFQWKTYGVASNGPIRSVGNPTCAILFVSINQALSEALGISLTTFDRNVEALQVLL